MWNKIVYPLFVLILMSVPKVTFAQCFDTELTEVDFPFNHLADLTVDDNDWDFRAFPGIDGNPGNINNSDGTDYTYKLSLSETSTIYITTCDSETDVDVHIALFTVDCDMASWAFYQDDSNTEILYPDGSSETYAFECISGFESAPYYANMLPKLILEAGTYYIVVDDRGGNTGSVKTSFGLALTVDSTSLSEDFSNINYYFSEGVYGGDYQEVYSGNGPPLDNDDYSLTINPNGGNATEANISSLTSLTGDDLVSGDESVIINIEYPNLPSGSESVTIGPASVSSIFNSIGIPLLDVDGITFTSSDAVPPDIDFVIPENGAMENDSITMSFSETLYIPDTEIVVEAEHLMSYIILKYNDISGPDIPFTLTMEGDPPSIALFPTEIFESETTIYFSFNAVLADENNVSVEFNSSQLFTVRDYLAPALDSVNFALNNSYLDLIFDDTIFGTNVGTESITKNNFEIEYFSNKSLSDTMVITSLTRTDSNFLNGGENQIRMNFNYNHTPNGNEKFILKTKADVEIFDEAGNQLVSNTTIVDTTQLYDILPPSVESISFPIDSFIVLMENRPITFLFNEKIDSLNFSISAFNVNSISFDSSKTDSSLSILLKPPFASYDSITVSFTYLEDETGLTTVDIAYTYLTPMLGDYNLDSKISFIDLNILLNRWNAKDFNFELAPVSGEAPHFISTLDSKFDLEDGMAFVQMWSWYQKNFGQIEKEQSQVGRSLEVIQKKDNISIIIDESIQAGQIQISYDIGEQSIQFTPQQNQDGELFMSSDSPERGFSIVEFSRTGEFKQDTISFKMDSEIEILNLYYKMLNGENIISQQGKIKIDNISLPAKFSLYPIYPNPFNPSAMISFDIPGTETLLITSLRVFDIKGRLVETLINKPMKAGKHKAQWSPVNQSSGIYFIKLESGEKTFTQKITYIK